MENENPALVKSPALVVRTMKIPAGGSAEMIRDADFISCLEADADFLVSFDSGPPAEFMAGLTYRTRDGFRRLEFINTTGAEINIKYALGRGDIRDARLTAQGVLSVRQEVPDYVDVQNVLAVNAASTWLVGAWAGRQELLIWNKGSGTVFVTQFNYEPAGHGMPLEPGGFISLQNVGEFYARNDSGAAVALTVAQNCFGQIPP